LTDAWSGTNGTLIVLRLAPFVLLLASWWTLRRWVVDALVMPASRSFAHAVAALVFVVGCASYLMSLRPEPLIAL